MELHDKVMANIVREIDSRVATTSRLNLYKLAMCTRGAKCYKDMDPQFLDDVKELTGTTNGLLYSGETICFLINAWRPGYGQPVVSFEIGFNGNTGEFRHAYYIQFKDNIREPQTRDEVNELGENTAEQVSMIIKSFFQNAAEKGYMYTPQQ